MNPSSRKQQEVISIVMAAAAGEATDEQLARLSRIVVGNDELSLFVVELLSQEAWLTWHGSQAQSSEQRAVTAQQLDHVRHALESNGNECGSSWPNSGDAIGRALAGADANESAKNSRYERSEVARITRRMSHRSVPAISAVLLLGLGAACGALATYWIAGGPFARGPEVAANADRGVQLVAYQARLLGGTACVWGPEMRSRISPDDHLRSGDSLNLIEGLAELELSWPARGNATLRLEGPAALILTADGGANLNYGKLTANVALRYDSYIVETPLGQVVVTGDANFGVGASTGAVEIHVFSGRAEVVSPWTSGTRSLDKLDVRAGQSIRLAATDAGDVSVDRGRASQSRFVSQVSMTSDLLPISDEYVDAIKQAAPVCYWRFDQPKNGVVRNVMGDRYHGRVVGQPDWVDEQGNVSIEFGAGLDQAVLRAYVASDRPLSEAAAHSYSIELWAKPSHYHLGAMAGLVSPPGNEKIAAGLHGVLLELGGARTFYSIIEHPGRVRFLHRDPPNFEPETGTSCFSKTPYGLRKWQHVVAVKDGTEMRVYVDGEVVATAEDNTPLSGGLELLVGQLDRERDWRPFIGQLDELAFYDRALSDPEIKAHYRLVRPVPAPRRSI